MPIDDNESCVWMSTVRKAIPHTTPSLRYIKWDAGLAYKGDDIKQQPAGCAQKQIDGWVGETN